MLSRTFNSILDLNKTENNLHKTGKERSNNSTRGGGGKMLRGGGRAGAVGHGPQLRLPHSHPLGHLPPQRPKQKGHQPQQQGAAQVAAAALPPSAPQPPPQQPQTSTAVTAAGNAAAEFPNCANDVLLKIGDFVRQWGAQPQHKGWNRTKQKEIQKCIDADLFCLSSEPSRRGQSRLNHLQRLRLLGIVCTYFSKEVAREADPALRYMHFEIIFCGREGEAHLHEARVHFLVKLCSLATQYPVYGLFEHVAHWVSKVTRDELKCAYMEQIVAELVDGFVITSANRRLHEFLLPLADHSMEFCANFVIFATTAESLGPALGELIGHWLGDKTEKFVHILRQNLYICQLFFTQKFDLLLRYDSTNSFDDDIHHRLHFVLLKFAVLWSNFKDHPKNFPFRPKVDSLLDVFTNQLNTLVPLAEQRLVENIIKCSGFIHMEPFRKSFESIHSLTSSHRSMLEFALRVEQQK